MAYEVPTSDDLIARYPAFAAVDPATIAYWITDAQRSVDTSWSEGDYAPALLSLAAHNMALAGIGADSAPLASIPAGVTQMRSGSFSLSLTPEAANARAQGTFAATRYGQEYLLLLSKNRAGPRVGDTGVVPTPLDYPFGYPYGGYY